MNDETQQPKWLFRFTPSTSDFNFEDFHSNEELLRELENEMVGYFCEKLGVEKDFKFQGDGRKLTEEQVFVGWLRNFFSRSLSDY